MRNFATFQTLSLSVLALFSSGLFSLSAQAQNPYIREPNPPETMYKSNLTIWQRDCLPLERWVGESVILTPKTPSFAKFGYFNIRKEGESSSSNNLPYKDYVGKIGVVTEVKKTASSTYNPSELDQYSVKLKLYSGENLIANFPGSGFENNEVFLKSDIDDARNKWIGKKLWFIGRTMTFIYDDKGELNAIANFAPRVIKQYQLFTVKDVVLSDDVISGIRFILSENKHQNFLLICFGVKLIKAFLVTVPNNLLSFTAPSKQAF
jgi:hypothetical protein